MTIRLVRRSWPAQVGEAIYDLGNVVDQIAERE
jgi:hypothetical protein